MQRVDVAKSMVRVRVVVRNEAGWFYRRVGNVERHSPHGMGSQVEYHLPSLIFLFTQLRQLLVAILRCAAQNDLLGPGLALENHVSRV